ncbi:MAG: Rpp14/Pop5 family protein [Candidatus Woesearchaeota archaeon]
MSIKPLKPSLREAKRYIYFTCTVSDTTQVLPSGNQLYHHIVRQLHLLFGSLLVARMHLSYIPDSIIAVNQQFQHHVRAALASIQEYNNIPLQLRSVKSSGILQKVKLCNQ